MKKTVVSILLLLALFSIESKAQNYFPFTCSNEKPFTEKDFKKWLEINVSYIITKAEKKAFLSLKTDENRNTFIQNFWRRRDPNPDTEENEFRGEYCDRLIETIQFDAGMPGWKTDRGFIYILYGKPNSIERGQTDFENLKSVWFERWHYKYLEGLCSEIDFTFIDPAGSNEFRLKKNKREELLKSLGEGLVTKIGISCRQKAF